MGRGIMSYSPFLYRDLVGSRFLEDTSWVQKSQKCIAEGIRWSLPTQPLVFRLEG